MAAVLSRWSYQAPEDAPVMHSAASPKFVLPEPRPVPAPDPHAALIAANRARVAELRTSPYGRRPPRDVTAQCGLTTVPQQLLAAVGGTLLGVGAGSARYDPGPYSLKLIGAGILLVLIAHLERPTRLLVLFALRCGGEKPVVLDCPLAGNGCAQNCLSQRRLNRSSQRPRATATRAPHARRRSGSAVPVAHAGGRDRLRPRPSGRAARLPAR